MAVSCAMHDFDRYVIQPVLDSLSGVTLFVAVPCTIGVLLLSICVNRLYLHPLSHIPGPVLAKLTSFWLYNQAYHGTEASTLERLHQEYGKVVRIGPNHVAIDDGAALFAIFVKNKGLQKHKCHRNIDIDGIPTIVSVLDNETSARRAKPVASMFSTPSVQQSRACVVKCVDRMVERFSREIEKARGQPVDVLRICWSLGLDTVTSYAFGSSYFKSEDEALPAAQFLGQLEVGGRWFYLPSPLFRAICAIQSLWRANAKVERHQEKLIAFNKYREDLVDKAVTAADDTADGTFQARLLRAGHSRSEIIAQCGDILAAGTDPIGLTLATICFNLAAKPDKYNRLKQELCDNPDVDPQSLPYLSSVVTEGLRVSFATQTLMPRVVSPSGLKIEGLPDIPPGTTVSICARNLHFNSEVFPNPRSFEPERWVKPSKQMVRDLIPFSLGPRQCLAKNLAKTELLLAVEAIARNDLLAGARPVAERIEIAENFIPRVKSGKVELVWDDLANTSPNTLRNNNLSGSS